MNDTPFDSKRRLCPDGSCVGVIGAEGRCSVCGRSASGKPDISLVDDAPAPEAREVDSAAESTGFDSARRLCDDGSCVGVIGAEGRCSVCGRVAP